MAKKKHKAIGLFSGGLDSILAIKLIQNLGIDVTAVHFVTPFFSKKEGKEHIKKVALDLGIKLQIVPLGEDYIAMVEQPKFGYGQNINPCIDCKIFMFKKSKELMTKIGADFVFTGEVLGERPMSQNIRSLQLIEKESGLKGRLLRPLSARNLETTLPEKEKIVNRNQLLDIKGRSRRPQMALAEKLEITNYPNPAGGCLLTDDHYTERLKDAFALGEDSANEIELLKHGRHFRLPSGAKVIVGRNEEENKILQKLIGNEDLAINPVKLMGPFVILKNYRDNHDIEIAAGIGARYCDGSNDLVEVKCGRKKIKVKPLTPEQIKLWRINRS